MSLSNDFSKHHFPNNVSIYIKVDIIYTVQVIPVSIRGGDD